MGTCCASGGRRARFSCVSRWHTSLILEPLLLTGINLSCASSRDDRLLSRLRTRTPFLCLLLPFGAAPMVVRAWRFERLERLINAGAAVRSSSVLCAVSCRTRLHGRPRRDYVSLWLLLLVRLTPRWAAIASSVTCTLPCILASWLWRLPMKKVLPTGWKHGIARGQNNTCI